MEHFDAIVVGAGFGGIGAAIQLKQLGYDNIAILDREDDVGGTWHVNRYPGLTVDVPSTTYSYWFEPNPYWSRLFAPGPELKRYAEHVSDKYDVRRHMRFNTTVAGAHWNADDRLWEVALVGGDRLSAQFLVAATGFLSQPRVPDIPGIDTFAGRTIHAASWDDDYRLQGRRAAIIGTGSTGVQLIPELAKQVGELTVYQRTPIWVLPKLDIGFAPVLQRLFARVPLVQRTIRWFTDTALEFMMVLAMWRFRRFRRVNTAAMQVSKAMRFLSIRDKHLRAQLNPDYDYGCKRPTVSNSYYRTFAKDHVHLETAGIARVEPDGIVTADGRKTHIDTLVLATGFDVWEDNLPAFEVIGRDGCNLGKWWRETRFQAYEGISVPFFPNFLAVAGPYAWLGLSWFNTVECQMRHMNRLFGEMQRRGGDTFEVTEEANNRFLDRMSTLLDDSVFRVGRCGGSRSYWFDPSGDAPLFRPTTVRQTIASQDRFPLSDYAIT
ncbi:NAD(P)/FAD-dependent oxidoreductase [Mycolicibacillus parakoreensis]|uniref:NAD(P)/FAD-dependent oxidoreductase n=1 Tax=Mycolicibacillus parakoreensis TaxID=1069221 RepID=A0ABY3TVE0_9MYCO|nr:NAD(P)/FAD-dependent oxidoreductase [Mycolicibacillus parakoreensis]MCV7315902.1 NAD(P)/FAD-dependent oxidoreductase [Mycolicibacillus parakoreensis]ULN51682.1 NAD(P)/FAD-dependent oxidoreductase [Mycolicibacillus parakoreensis]